jgi:long-chain-acyl-CoA dehydrogenase
MLHKTINGKCLIFRMYANCSGPGFALHSDIVMPYISHYGTREQIEKFIPAMTAGKCIGAIAMTEPGAGR